MQYRYSFLCFYYYQQSLLEYLNCLQTLVSIDDFTFLNYRSAIDFTFPSAAGQSYSLGSYEIIMKYYPLVIIYTRLKALVTY